MLFGRGAGGPRTQGGRAASAAVIAVALGGIMATVAHSVEGEGGARAPLYREALRPQFHFTARYWEDYRLDPGPHQEGWMNDMNGLVYNEGVYHFFLRAFVHRIRRIAIRVRRIEDRAAIDLGNPPATIFVPSSPLQPIHSLRLQGLTFAPPGC